MTTILHLSDIHFGSDHYFSTGKELYSEQSLTTRLFRDLSQLAVRPNIVVVSGDLTSRATRDEFVMARNFLEEIQKQFELEKTDFVICPGNHDVVWTADSNIGSRGEYESFAARFFGQAPTSDFDLRSAQHSDVYVLSLDTTLMECKSKGGLGIVGQSQLDEATIRTQREASLTALKILVIHHHLLPVEWNIKPPENYPNSQTLDSRRVIAWAQEHGFRFVLHGHQHMSMATTTHMLDTTGGPIGILSAPSAASKDLAQNARNGYQIITIDLPSGKVTAEVRRLAESDLFVPEKTFSFQIQKNATFASEFVPQAEAIDASCPKEVLVETLEIASTIGEIIKKSYGPHGALRGIATTGGNRQAKDGLAILDSIRGHNSIQQKVLDVVRTLAYDMSSTCGNSRKTACLIFTETVRLCVPLLLCDDCVSRTDLVKGISLAASKLREELAAMSQRICDKDQIESIALTACNGDVDIASAVADAMAYAGKDGLIQIHEGNEREDSIELEINTGPQFDWGIPEKVNGFHRIEQLGIQSEYQEPLFLIVYGFELDLKLITKSLEYAKQEKKLLVIVCPEIASECFETCVTNSEKGIVESIPLALKRFGDERITEYQDLATLTGAVLVDSVEASALPINEIVGRARAVRFGEHSFSIEDGKCNFQKRDRVNAQLKKKMETTSSAYEREKLDSRWTRLNGQLVTIQVSGVSESSCSLRRSLLADALHSCRAAVEAGYVSGGNFGLRTATKKIRERMNGQATQGLTLFLDAIDKVCSSLDSPSEELQAPLEPVKHLRQAIAGACDALSRIITTATWEQGGRLDETEARSRAQAALSR